MAQFPFAGDCPVLAPSILGHCVYLSVSLEQLDLTALTSCSTIDNPRSVGSPWLLFVIMYVSCHTCLNISYVLLKQTQNPKFILSIHIKHFVAGPRLHQVAGNVVRVMRVAIFRKRIFFLLEVHLLWVSVLPPSTCNWAAVGLHLPEWHWISFDTLWILLGIKSRY